MKDLEIRLAYRNLLNLWKECFPDNPPPAPTWWSLWLRKYGIEATADVIPRIAALDRAPRGTDEIGKVISATLRDENFTHILEEEAGARHE